MKKLLLILILFLLVFAVSAEEIVQQFYRVVNDYRINMDMQPLEIDPGLEEFAYSYLKDCLEEGDIYHNLWSTSEIASKLYYYSQFNYRYIDEILQRGPEDTLDSAVHIFFNFISSPRHREAIERPDFEKMGAALRPNPKRGEIYFAAYVGDLNE